MSAALSLPVAIPQDLPVAVLPPFGSPRIVVAASNACNRVRWSRLYPASRLSARLLRLVSRLTATAGRIAEDMQSRPVQVSEWISSPDAIVVLLDAESRMRWRVVVAGRSRAVFLKVVPSNDGDVLRRELDLLRSAGESVAPKVLGWLDDCNGYTVLCTEFLDGRPHPVTLVPSRGAVDCLRSDSRVYNCSAVEHPWFLQLADRDVTGASKRIVKALSEREWPVVTLHGDFTPWNTVVLPGGTCRLVDWEAGCRDGFPFVDEAHWILQVGGLVRRSSPQECLQEYHGLLSRLEKLALTDREVHALFALAALHDLLNYPSSRPHLMRLRREVVASFV